MSSTERIAKLPSPQKGLCRGCHKPVPKGRRTWCSQACVDAALIKMSPSVARFRVEQRDSGICAGCGFDSAKGARILRWLQRKAHGDYWQGTRSRQKPCGWAKEAVCWLARQWGGRADMWSIGHLWEADHIRPVVEGGGACELENYRTLCIPCHRLETKALAKRRAERRREQSMELLQAVGAVDPYVG